MRITFLSFYSGHIQRGAEVFVEKLAENLSHSNEVRIIQSGESLPKKSKVDRAVIPFEIDWRQRDHRMSLKRRVFLDSWSRTVGKFTTQALPKVGQTDIIIPVDGGWESLLTRLWSWKNFSKMVISGHSGKGWDDRINLLVRPDAFVALTQDQVDWASGNHLGVKIVKIHNGVDTRQFTPEVKPTSVDLPHPIVLCVGALEQNKRIDLLISAVAATKNVSLLLIGDGEMRKELIVLGNKSLGKRFSQISVPHPEMPSYYRAADIFSLPTVPWEPFGLVYLEAMASGLPIVAPDDPIRREIIGKAGLFVDPLDTTTYAKTLTKALSIPWGDKPRKKALEYSWEKIATQYEKLFNSL